jgi:hypothetical protein
MADAGDAERGHLFDLDIHGSSSRIAWNERWHAAIRIEVHPARRGQLDAAVVLLSEAGRRRAEARSEGPCEGLVRLVTGIEGDLGDRAVRSRELPGRALEPQAPAHLERRFAGHAAEDPVEVKRRETGSRGERLKLERFIERAGHVLDGPLHGLCVERPGVRLHHLRALYRRRLRLA